MLLPLFSDECSLWRTRCNLSGCPFPTDEKSVFSSSVPQSRESRKRSATISQFLPHALRYHVLSRESSTTPSDGQVFCRTNLHVGPTSERSSRIYNDRDERESIVTHYNLWARQIRSLTAIAANAAIKYFPQSFSCSSTQTRMDLPQPESKSAHLADK